MIIISGKKPRLRAKAAETRHLVPFAAQLADEIVEHDDSPLHQTIAEMFHHLLGFYMCMSQTPFNPSVAAATARQFCLLYSDISKQTPAKLWAIKPKHHLFFELGEFQAFENGNPALFWAYCDESFVGYISELAKTLGGSRTAETINRNVLGKYRGTVM